MDIPFQKKVDYNTYRQMIKLSNYGSIVFKNISKILNHMTAKIKPRIFNPFGPNSIIRILCNFKVACDTNGIYEQAAVWLFHVFRKESFSSTLETLLVWKREARMNVKSTGKSSRLGTYQKEVYYFLRTYTTVESIAGNEEVITKFTNPPNKALLQYTEELGEKVFCCRDV